jgi:hypothetical protein
MRLWWLLVLAACWTAPAPNPPPAVVASAWTGTLARCGRLDLRTTGAELAQAPDGIVFFDSPSATIKRLPRDSDTPVDVTPTSSQYSVTELAVGGDRVYWSMMGEYELRTALLRNGSPREIALPDKVHSIHGTTDGALVLLWNGDLFRIAGETPKPFVVGRKLKHVAVDGSDLYVEDHAQVFHVSQDGTFRALAKTGGALHEGAMFTARGGTVAWFTTDNILHILRPNAEPIAIAADGLAPQIVDGIVFFIRGLALYRVRGRTVEKMIDDQGEFADGMFHSFVIEDSRIVVVHDDGIRLFCRATRSST